MLFIMNILLTEYHNYSFVFSKHYLIESNICKENLVKSKLYDNQETSHPDLFISNNMFVSKCGSCMIDKNISVQ